MDSINAQKLKRLAEEGEYLISSNYEIPSNPSAEIPQPVFDWLLRCNNLLSSLYGKQSEVIKEFSKAYTLKMSVDMLRSLAAGEKTVFGSNTLFRHKTFPQADSKRERAKDNSIHTEIENQLLLFVEYSVPEEKKPEVTGLIRDLLKEVSGVQPNWNKVISYLKKGFDYGLAVGAELTRMAYSYYQARK